MFCKAITGGALDKRTLYTDADVHTTNFEGPALITSINMPSTEPDFLDRCIVINFDRLTESVREVEFKLEQSFKNDKASIFGGILNTLSKAMALYPQINPKKIHRLVGFSTFGSAIAQVLGYSETEFTEAIRNNIQTYKKNILLSKNPVGQALIDLYENQGNFQDTTASLFNAVNKHKPASIEGRWPKTAGGLGKMLKNPEIVSILADNGIDLQIDSYSSNKGTIVSLSGMNIDQDNQDSSTEAGSYKRSEDINSTDFNMESWLDKCSKLLKCHDCKNAFRLEEHIQTGDEEDGKNYCDIKELPFSEIPDEERINCIDFLSKEDWEAKRRAETDALESENIWF
jgi:hypothetical protein